MAKTRLAVAVSIASALILSSCGMKAQVGSGLSRAGLPVTSTSRDGSNVSPTPAMPTTTTSTQGQSTQIEKIMEQPGQHLLSPIVLSGAMDLTPPPTQALPAVTGAAALQTAERQPELAQELKWNPTITPVVKLALYSAKPAGGGTTQVLSWIIFAGRVPDPFGGPLGGVRLGGPTTTALTSPPLVDLLTLVNAATGVPGPSYSQSAA